MGSIIPLGLLVERLHCVVTWDGDECRVVHPELGALRIHMEDGCPYVTQRTATKLLEELEKKGKEKRKGRISEVKLKKVLDWETVRKVVELHPHFVTYRRRCEGRFWWSRRKHCGQSFGIGDGEGPWSRKAGKPSCTYTRDPVKDTPWNGR